MNTRNFDYKKGELIQFSDGEYSDYSAGGLFRILKDLNIRDLVKEYADGSDPRNYSDDNPSPYGFPAHLLKLGLVEMVDYRECHLTSYREFDSDFGVEYQRDLN